MTPEVFLARVVDPGLRFVAEIIKIPVTADARVMLMAVAGQESHWRYRLQYGGPARSFWQFESGGGVAGVLDHAKVGPWARQICAELDISSDRPTVYEAMAWNDTLATCLARLLLFTDLRSLPVIGDQAGAWDCYKRNWRPGKPRPESWPDRYTTAVRVVEASAQT